MLDVRPPHRRGLLIACLVIGLMGTLLRGFAFAVPDRSPDEQLYAGFGRGIVHDGLAWFPNTVTRFTNEGDVEYPWVHRAGYLSLVALAQLVTGHDDARAGETLSTVASVLVLALTGLLAWQVTGPLTAPLAMLFMAVSPLELAIARRAWQDTTLELFTTLLMLVLLASLRAARPWRWRLGFLALGAFTLLVKESAMIVVGMGGLVMVWDAWRSTRRVTSPLLVFVGGLVTLGLVVGALLLLCGGLENARELIRLTPARWAPDDYIRHYQSGGPGYYVVGLAILHPLPWLLGVSAALVALAGVPWTPSSPGGQDTVVQRVLALMIVVFLGVSCSYASKNMRFLSPVYPWMAVAAAVLVMRAAGAVIARLDRAHQRWGWAAVIALSLVMATGDALRFRHYFVDRWIQDLATPWFTETDAADRAGRN